MKLTLGFSPCPNDTFIFDALVNNKIDTEGLEFEIMLDDVQTLNKWALEKRLDISKISYGVWPLVLRNYNLLNSGGALGKGVGPLLVTKKESGISLRTINSASIAIPGENTTAHLLFSLAFPEAKNKVFTIFNTIEDAVINGNTDAGVIIHENRFTYQEKGLIQLLDLGEFWETETGLPIPLGGIVIRKDTDQILAEIIDGLIRKSIAYAFENHYTHLSDYVIQNAQEMNEAIMRKHIDLYVNEYSINLGVDGQKAVQKIVELYENINP